MVGRLVVFWVPVAERVVRKTCPFVNRHRWFRAVCVDRERSSRAHSRVGVGGVFAGGSPSGRFVGGPAASPDRVEGTLSDGGRCDASGVVPVPDCMHPGCV